MATPLMDSIQALINYSNETTGENDSTLSEAIDSLVNGFGGGGLQLLYENTFELPYYYNYGSYTTLATFEDNFKSIPMVYAAKIEFVGSTDEKHFSSGLYIAMKTKDSNPVVVSSDGSYSYSGGRSLTINISDDTIIFKCRSIGEGCIAEGNYLLKIYAIEDVFSGNDDAPESLQSFECVIDKTFEITETNESSTTTVVGTIDLSEYGTCAEVCSKDGNLTIIALLIDLINDKDGTRELTVKRALLTSYTTVTAYTGRSSSFAVGANIYSSDSAATNQQLSVSGYWDNGKIDIASRHVATPDVYTVKGTYRARIFKLNI